MSDKQVTVSLPEALVRKAEAAQVDMRAVFERALEHEVSHVPDEEQIEKTATMLREYFPEERVQEIIAIMRRGERVLGMFEGLNSWVSDDFDDPLPDEFWLSGDP